MALITVENLTKPYRRPLSPAGQVRALDGVSLTIERGETLGITGPNCAGKTTPRGPAEQ